MQYWRRTCALEKSTSNLWGLDNLWHRCHKGWCRQSVMAFHFSHMHVFLWSLPACLPAFLPSFLPPSLPPSLHVVPPSLPPFLPSFLPFFLSLIVPLLFDSGLTTRCPWCPQACNSARDKWAKEADDPWFMKKYYKNTVSLYNDRVLLLIQPKKMIFLHVKCDQSDELDIPVR